MASLRSDLREWMVETVGTSLKLLTAVGLGVLAGRGVSEQFPPQGAALAFTLCCGVVIVGALAFQVGRGYERA